MDGTKVFECVKLFEVEESQPTAEEEIPIHDIDSDTTPSSIGIDLCCWREVSDYSMLVLFCNNGYLVIRMTPSGRKSVIKQLKWFETRDQHILDIALDPLGEWLACACLNGSLYLLPVLSLTCKGHKLINSFGPSDDISLIQPLKKKTSPMCVIWWETMQSRHICITGSEVGEVTFFDLKDKKEITTIYVSGCTEHLLLAHLPDRSTHLLLGVRGGEWRRKKLEEHYHEAAGTSYSDAQASGFEILPDDMVIKSFLDEGAASEQFEMIAFPSFSEFNRILTQDWRGHHFLTALNLQNCKMEIFSYDFELSRTSLRTFQLVKDATAALLMDRLLFVISHNDEVDQCSFTLSIMSSQKASISDLTSPTPTESNSVLQHFKIPSQSTFVGFFPVSINSTTPPSHDQSDKSHDRSHDPLATPNSNLGGCLVVTTTGVYQCRQCLFPEDIFLELILSSKSHEVAEEFGITYRLDVCGLYQEAARKKMKEGRYSQAMKLFELSRCPSTTIIENFSAIGRVPELVNYLHQLVYDDTGHTSLLQPKPVQNVLLKCFIHECLRCHGQPEGAVMMDKFSQFLSEKFLYDQTVAMEMLIQCGMKEHLFDLAKTHHRLGEALEKMLGNGAPGISHSLQSSLTSRQYVKTVTRAANGLYLYQMTPANFIRLLYAKPSILSAHLPHLRFILPQLDIANLLRVTRLFDPSHTTIRPLLIKAHAHKKQSNSTGSLASIATNTSLEGPGQGEESVTPRLEAYIELFIISLIILNYRRKYKPAGPNNLLSLSPLRSAVSGSSTSMPKSPTSYTEGSQWVRGSTLSCGMHHAAVVVNGNLYTWGATKNGKLGHGDIEEEGKAAPLCVETIHMLSIHVVSVSCGAEHTIALCQEGIFSWGSSSHGQLGHGDTLKKTRPVQITALADKSIVSIVCGQYHSLALDDDHQVWSWGWGVHGQLGLRSVDDKTMPTHSSFLADKQVSLIAAGNSHSGILTVEGKVYTFGNGMYGQLGHGNTEKQSLPKMVAALSDSTVYLLACGNFHTVVVTTEQHIYSWGKSFNQYRPTISGQHQLKEYKRSRERQTAGIVGGISIGTAMTNVLSPRQISGVELDDTVMQISCGNHHSLLLTSAGSVYSWGSNMSGQLGFLHSGELLQPKNVAEFDGHKVVAIATGDEFSLVVDEKGVPWVWGRGDKGQLGVPIIGHTHSNESSHSRRSHTVIYKPHPISSISPATGFIRSPMEMSPEPSEFPVLELDLGWELPDFTAIDSPHTPYGRKALDAALENLYGFYRTSQILWTCNDWDDWHSMTKIANIEGHWSQAVRCVLNSLSEEVEEKSLLEEEATKVAQKYLEKFILQHSNYISRSFVREALDILDNLISGWEIHQLHFSCLEKVLTEYLSALSYPLSLILKSSRIPNFSFHFHLSVAQEVLSLVSTGNPTPDDIIATPDLSSSIQTGEVRSSNEDKPIKKLTIETSVGDVRLWMEILRNLTKDISKQHSINLSESVLASLRSHQQPQSSNGSEVENSNGSKAIATFSCGHAYPLDRFQNRILLEFVERVQDFPIPIPQTLKQLQAHYKHSQCYPSACPHCVFQFLRKFQMEECPKMPIKPWNF